MSAPNKNRKKMDIFLLMKKLRKVLLCGLSELFVIIRKRCGMLLANTTALPSSTGTSRSCKKKRQAEEETRERRDEEKGKRRRRKDDVRKKCFFPKSCSSFNLVQCFLASYCSLSLFSALLPFLFSHTFIQPIKRLRGVLGTELERPSLQTVTHVAVVHSSCHNVF